MNENSNTKSVRPFGLCAAVIVLVSCFLPVVSLRNAPPGMPIPSLFELSNRVSGSLLLFILGFIAIGFCYFIASTIEVERRPTFIGMQLTIGGFLLGCYLVFSSLLGSLPPVMFGASVDAGPGIYLAIFASLAVIFDSMASLSTSNLSKEVFMPAASSKSELKESEVDTPKVDPVALFGRDFPIRSLIGMTVIDINGIDLGEVIGVRNSETRSILKVGDKSIPFNKDVIRNVDIATNVIQLKLSQRSL